MTAADSPDSTMNSATQRTDPRDPSNTEWDRALVTPLDASYFADHTVVVYDPDDPEAWIESQLAYRRQEQA